MSQTSQFSEETLYENGSSYKKFSCNLCEFSNTNKGGMRRHINAKQKSSNNKRAFEESNDFDDQDKRPKIDDCFKPSLASTQIFMDVDDEKDEFEADESTNHDGKKVDENHSQQNNPQNPTVSAMLQADLAITGGQLWRVKAKPKI